MVEITTKRCYILWTKDKQGRVRHDPTAYTTGAACIVEGERQKDKGTIKDYNYSIVMQPQIGGEHPKEKVLTSAPRAPSVEL